MEQTDEGYWVPEHVRAWLEGLGYALPLSAMEGHVRAWWRWMRALGDFYNYRDVDGAGRLYEVHRRSLHPVMRVCRGWGSLLLNDKTQIACEDATCTEWLAEWADRTGFLPAAQDTVVRAFGLGTAAWALWVDAGSREVRVRSYDARMVVPLTWDGPDVTECAFVTRVMWRGEPLDQVQLHVRGGRGAFGIEHAPGGDGAGMRGGAYRIVTACFDKNGREVRPEGVLPVYETGSVWPTFSIVRPAIDNARADCSPYGQSVFADAVDAVQAVDLAFDAMVSEIDNGKMRVFLSDMLFDVEGEGGRRVSIPFGRRDCTVFRRVKSVEDVIQEFAPTLRTGAQLQALRVALQMLGDLCGLGIGYFDIDEHGRLKTATEVSSDNSALMRNIRRHEHALERVLAGMAHALLAVARGLGEELSCEGRVRVGFDDSIVTDTAAEKAQDMAEVAAGLMQPWEYRVRWYGEDEETARRALLTEGGAKEPELTA